MDTYDYRLGADSTLHGLIRKYMALLDLKTAPVVKLSNSLGAKSLGTCKWTPGQPTSTIVIQKAATHDPLTLERVVAHEMAHHGAFLDNILELQRLTRQGPDASHNVNHYLRELRSQDGHGEDWLKRVRIINALMGPGFVTETSDSTYRLDQETKQYYVLVAKLPNDKLGYQIGVNLSPKMKKMIEIYQRNYGARLVKTTDPKWQHGPRIGGANWATSADKQADMATLLLG